MLLLRVGTYLCSIPDVTRFLFKAAASFIGREVQWKYRYCVIKSAPIAYGVNLYCTSHM